MKAADV
ncbi:unnamed protein product [Linum tenue]|nr:unnamed protein product [Linum tenue]